MTSFLSRFVLLLPLASALAGVECLWLADPASGWLGSDIVAVWVAETVGFALVGVLGLAVLSWAELLGPEDLVGQRLPMAFVGGAGSLLTAGALAMGSGSTAGASSGLEAADLLLITMDTTRADALGLYGNAVNRTPVLDTLGREGVVFRQAIATAPQTGPSHLSILSGRYPHETGVFSNATSVESVGLLAERLGAEGWRTGAFVSGYPLKPRFGFQAGFEHYDALFHPHEGWLSGPVLRGLLGGGARERRGDRTVARAVSWLAQQKGPVFCWLHLYDPHGPYSAPGSFGGSLNPLEGGTLLEGKNLPGFWGIRDEARVDSGELVARYLEEVAWMDHQIGLFLEAARSRRPRSTPLVIAVADHGESYLEHGILFDHGDDLYEPAMRVPLLVSGGGFPKGVTSDCLVSTVDIVPTVAEVFGLEKLAGDGFPLKSALGQLEDCREREVFGSTVGSREVQPPIHHMIRSSRGKYLHRSERDGVFFDLKKDPGEESGRDTPGTMHERFLQKELETRLSRRGVRREREERPEVLQQLEQLGYVDKP